MHLDCTLPTLLQVQEGIKTRISSYNKIIDDQLAVAREKFAQDSIASRRADKVAAKKVPQRKLTMQKVAKRKFNDKKASPHPAVALMNDEGAMAKIREQYKESYLKDWRPGKCQRFSSDQVAILKEYFEQDHDWDFQKKMVIAKTIGLNLGQVKKWNYDEKSRRGMPYSAREKKI